jgi:two-component system cell cycle response regulator
MNESDDTTQIMKLAVAAAPTVLIVDDDDLVLARLQECVAAAGFVARTAAGGVEALASLETSFAGIVITDLNMPGMDGLDLCRRIRERDWPGYVYIVALTARNEEKDILAGLDAGADDYLGKSTSAAQFVARLRTATRVLALEHSLRSALETKRQLAMTDSLTGAFNRRYFMRHTRRELKRVQRFGGELSLLMLDVDHFKHVNDSSGHDIGDAVLKGLTTVIGQCLRRETDWCARIGGEEFAVVLEGTKLAGARSCAELLRHTIENAPIQTASGPIQLTVSIGIGGTEGTVDRASATVHSLMKQADANLYTSKATGRNRVTSPNSNGARAGSRQPSMDWSQHATLTASVSSVR